MTVHYVVRTFPRLSETFVQREVAELVRRGVPLTVWNLIPAEADEEVVLTPEVRAVVRDVPGLRTLVGAAVREAFARPVRFARAAGWCAAWAVRERDPRHLAAVPYAACLARRVPAGAHVHAHFANTPTTVALALGILGGQQVSFTGHARDLFAVTSPAFLADKVARGTFLAVGTEYSVSRIRPMVAPADAGKVVVVRNGLAAAPDVERAPEDGLVVTVARLVPKKGLPTLLRALALLRERGVGARVEIVGGGPQEDELRALAAELGLGDALRLAGPQGRDGVDDALGRAQVFALPCRREDDGDEDNLPVAILEAMQLGIPVVTTPIAGIPEAVIDGRSGLVVAQDDAAALADAIERLLGDAALREQLAAGAREVIAERFDVERNVGGLLARMRD
ncbi:glycosyltransferase family 4 protein [Svornostia abyssi]|uniref:Glycosyltransferase family 4 protein n=1 Tax=Svornostia abyssi TaxID=2898438 RepID=A0ABY5PLA5_9ACTN|nr:glycosyltransferase family 4 protein [Parviterribacteraceae bacterium J379]